MAESRLNIELFKAVRDKIADAPEAYDQTLYGAACASAPCGTAACIAGWACVLSGAFSQGQIRNYGKYDDGPVGAEGPSVSETARELLGLTSIEADVLFDGNPGGEWFDYDENGDDLYERCLARTVCYSMARGARVRTSANRRRLPEPNYLYREGARMIEAILLFIFLYQVWSRLIQRPEYQ